jgi:hypothetical protein
VVQYEVARGGAQGQLAEDSLRQQGVINKRRPVAERMHLKTIVRSGNGRDDEISRNGRVKT